ncbi:MAG: hypothetical protein A3G52_00220 [Candidatus Taylorbacteria bacterium RIFCSPLOWO2_12_FULL_43_20]|uniref:Band 7 domain-containing protein n=1 Tax=Candidatus Taylorbacteria bacterium RIFCSPLOWO2_12_FULL_43_20 TaxID=1802332 RepID=A0A1G2P1D5_9BACT|nr:MAG: hypothetical protein A2825_01615 [Candidatus Taylorbacteria bacterium RIFCSPHIGHO2_01_FULL_43_120]OHA23109.1 MAG: hypothetical protein A3B98_03590 [Candidatus Taylorbacteria bacterium RIFCSPHIGHO2_02_FULL_43_55]OHA28910.1 MAG: hypothetical protein A3E92_04540 [Candidatus Taylorbacteria bacterium RIFCSPHIGHO2_12_FULL_42_34]OHA30894.1 MAG: hypothetical protein A3B09_04490 [Candidatus Taylorbacteria bacterium RIFCSPLOWO2_01_FULL_43_83]OHA39312.1 MAG: hypothetical protein A3H58_03970 [Candi
MKGKMPKANYVIDESEMISPSVFFIWVIIIDTILVITGLILLSQTVWVINVGKYMLTLLAIYHLISIGKQDADKVGVKLFMGRRLYRLEPGIVFVPRLICKQVTAARRQILVLAGTAKSAEEKAILESEIKEAEKRNVEVIRMPEPQRITFAEGQDDKNTDELDRRITSDPIVILIFVVEDMWPFWVKMGNVYNAAYILIETAITVLQEKCAKLTAAKALEKINRLNEGITERIEELIGERETKNKDGTRDMCPWWGIDLVSARVKSMGFPRRVNEAIANKRQTIIGSQGQKLKLINEGTGTAEARKKWLNAEADGLKRQGEIAESEGGKVAYQAQIMREALERSNYTIFSGPAAESLINMQDIAKGLAVARQEGKNITDKKTDVSSTDKKKNPKTSGKPKEEKKGGEEN